ncbi:hypothetical protein MGALJ_60150 (plasmid) [Mycobacterium gallinarum]|uniref:Uncharacterized protein n=1 Tax=Mycobacterium gallinarum TaxID=39689 RepID=A0A9W4B923_9MYCO|nr:hypothetical protein MGALJ_60150 [Mycobacterium gallinarum]
MFLDVETGEPVDEHDIDFETADDPTLEPAEGYRHIRTVTETTAWSPEYYCCNPRGAGGHHARLGGSPVRLRRRPPRRCQRP